MLLTLGSAVKKNKEEKSFFDYVIESKESEVATSVVQHERLLLLVITLVMQLKRMLFEKVA